MKFSSPPGVFDIYPDASDSWKASPMWQQLERKIQDLCSVYGFQEIRTPIIEQTELFIKSTGLDTDIVSKEMYTFKDRSERSLTLRPEGTPAVLRALIEHKMTEACPVQKLFYIGPMFRYERQQAGRYRQHHQFGVEVLGVQAPEQDAELMDMLLTLYKSMGIDDCSLEINSLGDKECRKQFREALIAYLTPLEQELSKESQRRLQQNPLRILDSKEPQDLPIIEKAPSILSFLNQKSQDHFTSVQKRLDALGLSYSVNPQLVRGLDYYNETVFEAVCPSVNLSLGGGGRYDGLLKSLGGADLAGIGFATGMERILQAVVAKQEIVVKKLPPTLTLIPLGEPAKQRCLSLLQELRHNGVSSVIDYNSKKLGKAMRYANAIGSLFVLVVGDEELTSETISIKEMHTGNELSTTWGSIATLLRTKQGCPKGFSLPCGGVDEKTKENASKTNSNPLESLKQALEGQGLEEGFDFSSPFGDNQQMGNPMDMIKSFFQSMNQQNTSSDPSEEQKNPKNNNSEDKN